MSINVARRPTKRCCSVLNRGDGRKRRRLAAKCMSDTSVITAVKVVQEVQVAPKPTEKQQSLEWHSMGVFFCLPLEILQFIFTFLDCNSLGILGLSSSELCAAVQNYVYTHTGLKQVLPRAPNSFSEQVTMSQFGELGKSKSSSSSSMHHAVVVANHSKLGPPTVSKAESYICSSPKCCIEWSGMLAMHQVSSTYCTLTIMCISYF